MMNLNSKFRISILLWLVIFISLGICASVLTDRYGAKLDITENKLYTLSEETAEVLDGLNSQDREVMLTVFDLETDYPLVLSNLLKSYTAASDRLHVEYCDPYREPRKVREVSEQGFNVQQSDIAVRSDTGTELLTVDSLYELNGDGTGITCLMAEQQITSAIVRVMRPERGHVLFTDGHGETPSSSLMSLFENNHYSTSYGELSVQGIPEDTELVVLCAPEKDFSGEEIDILENYMARGGAVLCFADEGPNVLQRLSAFLEDRGIGITDETVREPDLCLSGNELSVVATYASHEINSYFTENRSYVVVPSCTALNQLYYKQGRTKTAEVLRSSAESYVSGGESGSRALCISSLRTATDDAGKETEQRLIVLGSGLIYGDDLLGESKVANAEFLLQVVSWLIGDEELLNIPVKNLDSDILPVTGQVTTVYSAVFMIGIPALILLLGLAVYIRRRYL